MSRKIAIINVGANSASGALKSPIFKDGTFEFVPVETDNAVEETDTYSKFKSYTGRPITDFISAKFFSELMHDDPEFVTYTYGDLPENELRSMNLKKLNKGDALYYFARLVEWNNGNWGNAGFYLVGKIVLDKVVKKSDLIGNPNLIKMVQNNAHVRRWLIKPENEPKNFWILVGSDQSKRFVHAVPFDKNILQKVLLRRDGTPIIWESDKTDLRTIGENTRTCRIIDDPDRIKILEEHVKKYW